MSSKEKSVLITLIEQALNERIHTLKDELKDIIASRDSESKSSAGDKYETSRAMMQIAQAQTERQLNQQHNLLEQIRLISNDKVVTTARQGALIATNHGKFFLAIGLGEFTTKAGKYILISPASPIGKAFEGKGEGDGFSFMGKAFKITSIT